MAVVTSWPNRALLHRWNFTGEFFETCSLPTTEANESPASREASPPTGACVGYAATVAGTLCCQKRPIERKLHNDGRCFDFNNNTLQREALKMAN